MNARILPLNSDEHRIAQELLPWFVNGTLDAAEAARVSEHVARCGICQAEVAAQAQLMATPLEEISAGEIDRRWAALQSRLELPTGAPGRPAAKAHPWWGHGLQLTIAIQAALIIVLAAALVSAVSPEESFRALGAPPAAEANALAVFRGDATSAQMSAALRAAGARIVGGPTVVDAYLLRLADPTPAALALLRAQPGVLSVESLQGGPAR